MYLTPSRRDTPLHRLMNQLLFSTYALQPYCAIWVRRSNFCHKASPRVSSRESTQRRKEELWARNVRKFRLNADLHVTFRDLLHAVKLRHGTNGFTSPPKEGVLRNFFSLKIRRLRPGANPRTWVPKASTLPKPLCTGIGKPNVALLLLFRCSHFNSWWRSRLWQLILVL